jgi:hypothetical protein
LVTQTKTAVSYSAGDGATFELVENEGKSGFAIYNLGNDTYAFSEQTGSVLPKQNVPWLLATMPIDYGNDYQLYQEVRKFIYDHVELPEETEYDIMTAWVLAAYRFQEFQSFPYVCAIGPPASGKTRLVKTLHQLSYRGIFGAALTASAMFRAIHRDNVSIYLDQSEHLSNSMQAPDFLAIVDNGYQKGGKKYLTNNETGDYESFNVYSPKAFASTKTLEETLESRSIRISMQARTRDISIKIDEKRATILRSKLLLYKFRNSEGTEDTEEDEEKLMSLTKDGRLIELFLPLYIVTKSPSFPSGPSSPSSIIIEYMKHKSQSRKDEEQVSVDAQIIRSITNCAGNVTNGKISLEILSFDYNCGKPEKEWWKAKTLAKKVRDLGFETCRMTNGSTGFYWNEKVLKKHQQRFMIEDKKIETPSIVETVQA